MPLTIFRNFHHLAGNAPDTIPAQLDLLPTSLRLDVSIQTNPALISFSSDGIYYTTERTIPAGVIFSIDQQVASIRIRNVTVGLAAAYDISAYYDPAEIVGAPFALTQRRAGGGNA